MPAHSGLYTLIRPATTTSTAITIQQVVVPASCGAEFIKAWINQVNQTASAQFEAKMVRKSTPATVTSATPTPMAPGMQASKCIGGAALTGINASGEGTDAATIGNDGSNEVPGWLYLPVPEERPMLINTCIGLKLVGTIASCSMVSGQTWLEFAS